MNKIKIIGSASESYPSGRIDSIRVPLLEGINSTIYQIFKKLDFVEDSLNDSDIDFENKSPGNYFFFYGNEEAKAWIIIEANYMSLILDNSLTKEKIVNILEEYFEFPN